MALQPHLSKVFSAVENAINEEDRRQYPRAYRPTPTDGPAAYAPPAVREQTPALPEYVTHKEGVPRVGALAAQAMVESYEEAAKAAEAMGQQVVKAAEDAMRELTDHITRATGRCREMETELQTVIENVRHTAGLYRDEAKIIFNKIEDCAMLVADVKHACDTLRARIAHGTPVALDADGIAVEPAS